MALYGTYGAIDATAPAQLAAYAVEQSLKKTWTNTLGRSTPLMGMLMSKKRLNKGFSVRGRMMIVPIIASESDIQFAGVADASQLTALTPTLTTGDTQAEFNFAHYRGSYYLTDAELTLLAAPEGTARGNILAAKKAKLESVVSKLLATNTAGTGVGSRTAHMGILNPVSASNVTVGGIAQADLSGWVPTRDVTGGVLGLQRVDDLWDQVDRGSATKPIDLLVCSYASGGPNIFNSFRQLIAASDQDVVVNDAMAEYGFRSFKYAGANVVGDSFMTAGAGAGKVIGLASESFYAASTSDAGKPTPKLHELSRLPGTDAFEQMFTLWFALGCDSPASNFHLGALTS